MWLTIPDWQIAGGFALLASVTFPVGAFCGVLSCDRQRKVNDQLLSTLLAIGAGSLIFAVAVEVYAEGLDAIEYIQPGYPICTAAYIVQILFAVAGALMYTGLERSVRKRRITLWHARGHTAPPLASSRAVEATTVTVSVTASGNGSIEHGSNAPLCERSARDGDAVMEAETRSCAVASLRERAVRNEDSERERLLREVPEELHEDEVHQTGTTDEAELEDEEALSGVYALREGHYCGSHRETRGYREILHEDTSAAGAATAPTGIGTTCNEVVARNFVEDVLISIQSYAPMLEQKYFRRACSESLQETNSNVGVASAGHFQQRERLERSRRSSRTAQQEADEGDDKRSADNLDLAFVLWTSQLLDAVPEAMMIGFRTAGDTLSWAFIIALCISNFPESFCGGHLMRKEGLSTCSTLLYWFAVSCFTAVVSLCTVVLTPSNTSPVLRLFDAAVQGIAAGAMLALATASMLPAAYATRGVSSGLYCVVGFLLSLSTRLVFGLLNGPAALGEEGGTVIHASRAPISREKVVAGDGSSPAA